MQALNLIFQEALVLAYINVFDNLSCNIVSHYKNYDSALVNVKHIILNHRIQFCIYVKTHNLNILNYHYVIFEKQFGQSVE